MGKGMCLGHSPSMLKTAVDKISKIGLNTLKNRDSTEIFNITEKLNYNCIRDKRLMINELKVYYHKLNILYNELDDAGSFKKENLLENIHHIYLEVSGRYIGQNEDHITIIQQNSDAIFESVLDRLMELIHFGNENVEDLLPALRVIMVDAFMRCKIFEEPNKENG